MREIPPVHSLAVPFALILVIFAACRNVPAPPGGEGANPGQPTPAPADPASRQATPFPQWAARADRDVPDARLEGTLVLEGGCLRVRGGGDAASYLVVWPPHARLESGAGEFRVVDSVTQVSARIGETVRLGGGEVAAAAPVLRDMATPLPAACAGPIWLASGMLR